MVWENSAKILLRSINHYVIAMVLFNMYSNNKNKTYTKKILLVFVAKGISRNFILIQVY